MIKTLFTCIGLLIFSTNNLWSQALFTQPAMNFIQVPSETITNLSFNSASISTIQNTINNTRSSNPNNIIRIILTGNFLIQDAPLQISSKMLLFLNNATIYADNNTTTTSLISIYDALYVSIGSTGNGVLNGNNSAIEAIDVNISGKTHIDNLIIQNCNAGGISYTGNGMSVYGDAGSVTRCTINNCNNFGMNINNAYHFIATDNFIKSNSLGIILKGDYAALANNTISNCSIGILDSSSYESISYNNISNCTTGISLTNSSNQTFVAHNIINNNSTGIDIKSTKARIYYNNLTNTTDVVGGGTSNQLFCNYGLTSTEGNVSGCTFFNPPLLGNEHNNLIKIGKGRFDVTIGSYPFQTVRCLIDAAHSYQPNAVIVAHLIGNYETSGTTDSLLIKEDECILLNGTINGTGSCGTVVNFNGSMTSSFSGGTIDGNNTNGTKSLVYITGSANVVLDSITVINGVSQGIYKQNSFIPTFVRGCTVNNCTIRGIWELASSGLYALENRMNNTGKYGIDLDAFSSNSVLLKNHCSNNNQNGIFIEEGANHNLVQANMLDSNSVGIGFYNQNVNNNYSSNNLLAQNYCTNNNRGILLNASAATKATINNTVFNNTCINNTDVGIGGYYNATNTYNNYNALNCIQNNKNGSFYALRNYSANYDWNMY